MKVGMIKTFDSQGNELGRMLTMVCEYPDEEDFFAEIDVDAAHALFLSRQETMTEITLEDETESLEQEDVWVISGFITKPETAEDKQLAAMKAKLSEMKFYDWDDFEGMSMVGLMEMMLDFAEDVSAIIPSADD
jgi:hypothetical protein